MYPMYPKYPKSRTCTIIVEPKFINYAMVDWGKKTKRITAKKNLGSTLTMDVLLDLISLHS